MYEKFGLLNKTFHCFAIFVHFANRLSYKSQSEGGTKGFHSKLTKDFFESIVH